LRDFIQSFIWPALAGLLAAVLILDRWVLHQPLLSPRDQRPESYRNVVAQATPSVVNIYTAKLVTQRSYPLNDPLLRRFLRTNRISQRLESSLGSGVIMSNEGHIITNNHVIADAELIQIRLHDGRTANAVVIASDPATDLAILKTDLDNLTPIEVADSDQISVGDIVLSIGNPYGFGHSVSQGIISGLGRYGLQMSAYEDYIQTDASIHFGSSGGALIDTRGRLVGINTLIFTANGDATQDSSGIGINLATPSNLAAFVMDDLIRYGKVVRGWLGVSVELRAAVDPTGNPQTRLVVSELSTGGPAQLAGIQVGDAIVSLDGATIDDGRIAMHRIARLRPGEAITVGVERGETQLEMEAVVGTRPGVNS
jgi:serine protease DegS